MTSLNVPGTPTFSADSCQGYHVLSNAPLFESRALWHFRYLQSKLESSFRIWPYADHGSSLSKYILALLEPVRKLSPAYEVNLQYSPNMSGKSKRELSEPQSGLGKGMRM